MRPSGGATRAASTGIGPVGGRTVAPIGLLRRGLVTVIAAVGLAALGVPAALGEDDGHGGTGAVEYVNMGDSYSAASGVLPPAPGAPPQCLQSARNWGHVLADRWGYDLTDVSCGAAETRHYTEAQYPGVPRRSRPSPTRPTSSR